MPIRSFFAALVAASAAAISAQPNVVLLSVDTLRADHLGCYGYDKPTSPNIDKLAQEGLLFEDAVCDVPLTAPSMAGMLTGHYPRDLGLTRNGVELPESLPTVAERFKDAGYATWCVQSNWTLKSDLSRINRGFDIYRDDFHKGRWGAIKSERPGPEVADIALELLAARDAAKPFFAWIHFSDPHGPYEFHEEFNPSGKRPWRLKTAEKVRVQYDSEVLFTDHHIGRVLKALPENTIVVFVADHGESLYEHGYLGHGRRVYHPGIHVPLIIHAPGRVAPGRSSAPVRGADVGPTILGLAGLPALEGAEGVDIIATPPAADRVRIVEAHGGAAIGIPGVKGAMASMEPEGYGVIFKGWKLVVQDNTLELFNLAEDPRELDSRYAAERPRAAEMQELLKAWQAQAPKVDSMAKELTNDDVEALKALGYIE
jgi:choline-sulfatase